MEAAKDHILAFDPSFAYIFDKFGELDIVQSQEMSPFEHLCRSIISQQLSVKAAAAVNLKFKVLLVNKINKITPAKLLEKTTAQLRECGLSVRKASYLQDLATKFSDGTISETKLMDWSDDEVCENLLVVKGIGPWTVDMFMIFYLNRLDVLPIGDLAFRRGAGKHLGTTSESKIIEKCLGYAPYRSLVAKYFWKLSSKE